MMDRPEPIRVLQIIGIVCGGGVEAVIMNYYRHIDRSKVQFDFIIDGKEKSLLDDEIESLGGKVYHVTPYKENIFRYMYDVYKVMKDNPYEIIHDNMNTMALFSLFPAWLAGKRIRIIHNHSTNAPASKESSKYFMKKILRPFAPAFANRYLACSRYAAAWMYGEKALESGKVRIINNAIDVEKFAFSKEVRQHLRKELGVKETTIVIGHIGRFVPQKNHNFLIETYAQYLKLNSDALLMLIGDGPLREEVQTKVKELHLNKKVAFLGLQRNVHEWYSTMDVFVLPSLYEGLPVVAVEAQANGVPMCLSTAITQESIINKNTKYLNVDAQSSKWVEAIEYLANKRIYDSDSICKRGFSIKLESQKLEEWYMINAE